MRYIVSTPWWLRLFFPKHLTWELPTQEKVMYLTFDDGPHPEITPFVLRTLKQYDAKATFFCIGNNVQQYPEIYREILLQGHRTGNHTFHHLNCKNTDDSIWLGDVKKAAEWIDSDLMRPPYGRINAFCANVLQQAKPSYRIIMWTVISADFDTERNGIQCFEAVKKHAGKGSIIVFHDSEKAKARLTEALPMTLEHFANQGFVFKTIP